MNASSDKIQVINFWATWCAPCVKELPLFEKLGQERKDVKVTLVSMDLDLDPNPDKVYRFIARKKIQSEVLILDEKIRTRILTRLKRNGRGLFLPQLLSIPVPARENLLNVNCTKANLKN